MVYICSYQLTKLKSNKIEEINQNIEVINYPNFIEFNAKGEMHNARCRIMKINSGGTDSKSFNHESEGSMNSINRSAK